MPTTDETPSWLDHEAAMRLEAARARARTEAKALADGLRDVRRHQDVTTVAKAGPRRPDIGNDPSKWPKTIDTRGYVRFP
jgi:hypothetical protein